MYGCENWTIKKAEHQRIDAFELWCWRRLLRVLDSKEIKPINPKGKVKSENKVPQPCLTLCYPMVCSPPGSSMHGIFQARILEWVAISFPKGNQTWIFIGRIDAEAEAPIFSPPDVKSQLIGKDSFGYGYGYGRSGDYGGRSQGGYDHYSGEITGTIKTTEIRYAHLMWDFCVAI